MDLILAFLAGLLTLLNPCVLPVLPIVLQSALQQDRRAPLALAAGMSLSFVALGLGLSALGPLLGLSPEGVAQGAGLVMAIFGLLMLMPRLAVGFEAATAGLAARADARIDAATGRGSSSGWGLGGQAVAGLLLGAAWSPCIGPPSAPRLHWPHAARIWRGPVP
jgi:cytochrome c biogenesis protein CcdA